MAYGVRARERPMLMSHLDNEVYSWQHLSSEPPPHREDAGARKLLYLQIRVLLGLED